MYKVAQVFGSMVIAIGIGFLTSALFIKPWFFDAIIPLILGILLAVIPQWFATKAYQQIFKIVGLIAIGIGIFYFVITLIGGSI